jgi:hypothetical protein
LFDQECKDKEGKGYTLITDLACKAIDMCGIQAHAGYYVIGSGGKAFEFDIDKYPSLYLTMKAETGTDTCLVLKVHDKEPKDYMRRFVAIGKTRETINGTIISMTCVSYGGNIQTPKQSERCNSIRASFAMESPMPSTLAI